MSRSSFWLTALTVSLILSGAQPAVGTPQKITNKVEPRIINGQRVIIDQYPYLVAVLIWGSFQCGGSIISRRVVLTAAHCLVPEHNARKYSVIYGQSDIAVATKNVVQVERIAMHPQYNYINMDYDAGLLYLAKNIPFGQSAQCIKLAVQRPRAGSRASIAGWGETQTGVGGRLNAVILYTIAQLRCSKLYRNMLRITQRMLCAGVPQGGKDACQGDSGGPLVVADQQVGICSSGVGCGLKGYPGLYGNVAALRGWILSHVNISCSDAEEASTSKGRTKGKWNYKFKLIGT